MSGRSLPSGITTSEVSALLNDVRKHPKDCQWISEHIEVLFDTLTEAIKFDHLALDVIEILNFIFPCIITRDDYRRWDRIFMDALMHAQLIKDNESQMQLWAELGQNYLQFGLRKEAYEAFSIASERGEDFNVPEMELLGKIGQLRTQAIYQKGHYNDLVPEILALAKQVNKPICYAMAHSALALGHTLRHETAQSFEHGQMAYIWWNTLNNYAQKADAAFMMAQACRLGSQIEQSYRYLQLAEQQLQNPEHLHKLGAADYERGTVELEVRKNAAEAEKCYLLALERFSKLDYPYLTAATHHVLGITQTKLEKFSEARSHLKVALRTWVSIKNNFEQASVIYAIGFLAFKEGRVGSALRWYRRSLKILEGIADSPSRQQLEISLCEDIEKALGEFNKPAQ